jgi:hypothetical protein
VTTEPLPFAIAAPTDDQRIFLASQIADEARPCSSSTAPIGR